MRIWAVRALDNQERSTRVPERSVQRGTIPPAPAKAAREAVEPTAKRTDRAQFSNQERTTFVVVVTLYIEGIWPKRYAGD